MNTNITNEAITTVEQSGAGMIIFADKEGHIQYATTNEFHFNQLAPKEHSFNVAKMLNDGEEVTEEGDALELLFLAIREVEHDKDHGTINREQFENDWDVLHWTISSLLGSPCWCVVVVTDDEAQCGGMGWQTITTEEFAKRELYLQSQFDKLAA